MFRLRLGKALDFDFMEDWQGSLFSRADPKQGGPALDVERAMNKLEKAALRYTRKKGRPLVLAFNSESMVFVMRCDEHPAEVGWCRHPSHSEYAGGSCDASPASTTS